MKRFLIAFGAVNLWLMLFAFSAQETIQLATNNVTDYQIVLPESPSAVQTSAADELAGYLQKITGAQFSMKKESEIEVDSQGHYIVIGPSQAAETLLTQAGLPGEENYPYDLTRIEQVGNTIILTGHPVRGPLYAVYTFLEDNLGCRWWTADEESIPHTPSLSVQVLPYHYHPQLISRETDYHGLMGDNWRFAAKMKLNGSHHGIPAEFGGRVIYHIGVHSFYPLIPPEKYFNEHPEWFSELDGVRKIPLVDWWNPTDEYRQFAQGIAPEHISTSGSQLCLTNDELVQEMLKNIREILSKQDHPQLISISQNDCMDYCTCEKCRKIDEEESSPSGTLLRFVNKIAEDLEKDYPDLMVETFAYTYTRKAPKITHARKNVVVRLCSIECTFSEPFGEGTHNTDFETDIEQWKEKAPNLIVWDYITDFARYLTPFPNYKVWAKNIRYFIDHNAIGLFEEADNEHDVGDFLQLRAWVFAKLLWNPSLDQNELIKEFISGYYAPELVPIYCACFDKLTQAINKATLPIGCFEKSTQLWLDLDTLTEVGSLMDQAEEIAQRLAKEDPEKYASLPEKVQRERVTIDWVQLECWKTLKYRAMLQNRPFVGPKDPNALAERFLEQLDKYHFKEHFSLFPSFGAWDQLSIALKNRFDSTKYTPVPEPFQNLPKEEYFYLQDADLFADAPGYWTFREEDPKASDGWAIRLRGNQTNISIMGYYGRFFQLWKEKYGEDKKVHLYAWIRTSSPSNEGTALSVGISDAVQGIVVARKDVPLSEINHSDYQMIDIGTFTPDAGCYLWMVAAGRNDIENIWIDRLIFVLE